MEHQRGGGLYFKSGKDACMSSNLKALHIYFYSLQENPQRSLARLKKNHWANNNKESWLWPWNGKKMRWTLLLGKSERNEKINLVIVRSLQVNPAIRKHQVFQPCHRENLVNFNHQEGHMSTLQSRRIDVSLAKSQKSKKERKLQVTSLIIPYHQKEKWEEPYDTTKRLISSPKCRSVEVINTPARPGSNHREVNCINYK